LESFDGYVNNERSSIYTAKQPRLAVSGLVHPTKIIYPAEQEKNLAFVANMIYTVVLFVKLSISQGLLTKPCSADRVQKM
jgi:hypothetical protein